MQAFRITGLIVLAAVVLPNVAWADDGFAEQRANCASDLRRFCPEMKVDSTDFGECLKILKAHAQYLGASCRSSVDSDRVSR